MRVRIPADRSILHALRVERASATDVCRPIVEQHYLHSMPAVVRECYRVDLEGELVGACVLTAGARHSHRLLQGAQPHHVVTLARLWLADELPSNSESRVLGILLRLLANAGRCKLIASYADPAAGHLGTIYQATGWIYLGTTDPGRYLQIGGASVHPRTAHSRYGTNNVGHLQRTGVEAEWRPSVPKHRYVYVLDRRWRWRLRSRPQPYPKRGGRGPPARPDPRSRQRRTGPREAATPREPMTNPCGRNRHVYYSTTKPFLSMHRAVCNPGTPSQNPQLRLRVSEADRAWTGTQLHASPGSWPSSPQ